MILVFGWYCILSLGAYARELQVPSGKRDWSSCGLHMARKLMLIRRRPTSIPSTHCWFLTSILVLARLIQNNLPHKRGLLLLHLVRFIIPCFSTLKLQTYFVRQSHESHDRYSTSVADDGLIIDQIILNPKTPSKYYATESVKAPISWLHWGYIMGLVQFRCCVSSPSVY